MAFWTRHKIPYVNFHELNDDWIIEKVFEYIEKVESIDEFVKLSIDEQNAIIKKAVEDLANGMQELRDYIMENLEIIANEIINKLIESGVLYVGMRYNAETEELNIILTREV